MVQVSAEEYRKMCEDDRQWAQKIIDAIHNDPRPFVKYKDQRLITTIRDILVDSAKIFPDNVAFYTKFEKGPYKQITYKEFLDDVNALGTAFHDLGLKDNRVAIIGDTNYTWSIADLAVCCGTGIAVPLDRELPYADLKNLIIESGSTAVSFDKRHEPIFAKMMAEGDTPLRTLIAQQEHEDRTVETECGSVTVLSQWKLLERGKELVASGDRRFIDAQIDSREMSILLFTSGTTGMAKGIMLSHRNICADIMIAPTVLAVYPNDIFFSVLPIHHTYEYCCDFLMPIYKGAAIAHCEGLKYIVRNMQEAHPTMLLAVPAIYEALNKQIWKGIRAKGKEATAKKGIKLSLFFRRKLHIDISDMFFKEIKQTVGGKMRLFITGGAAINPAILDNFQAFGINAVQGYGLSECAPMGALNPDTAPKSHSIGVHFPGCDAMIFQPGPDGIGEICLQGENVMLGYYNRPDLTAETVRDGWLHTGDLGYIDKDGYIVITGRAKNVIITNNGKNVFPEELEYQLCLADEISEAMVFQEDSENKEDTQIAATIVPDWERLRELIGNDADDADKVFKYIWGLVDKVNDENPGYKMIRRILIRHTPLEKNTSNKVVRFLPGNREAN